LCKNESKKEVKELFEVRLLFSKSRPAEVNEPRYYVNVRRVLADVD
jgi:hypothetical protein